MKISSSSRQRRTFNFRLLGGRSLEVLTSILLVLVCAGGATLYAQKKGVARPQKLPSPDKVIGDYLKATGGKKRVAAIRDATYEWAIQLKNQPTGQALIKV